MIQTKIIFFSKHQNKAEFKNLDDSLELTSDFSGLRTSAVSMTSTASMTSVASMTSTASIHQNIYWSWWLDHHWHPNDQYQPLFVEWIIKIQFFHWYLIPFLSEAVKASLCQFFKNWLMKLKYPNLKIIQIPSNKTLLAYFYLSGQNYMLHFTMR